MHTSSKPGGVPDRYSASRSNHRAFSLLESPTTLRHLRTSVPAQLLGFALATCSCRKDKGPTCRILALGLMPWGPRASSVTLMCDLRRTCQPQGLGDACHHPQALSFLCILLDAVQNPPVQLVSFFLISLRPPEGKNINRSIRGISGPHPFSPWHPRAFICLEVSPTA